MTTRRFAPTPTLALAVLGPASLALLALVPAFAPTLGLAGEPPSANAQPVADPSAMRIGFSDAPGLGGIVSDVAIRDGVALTTIGRELVAFELHGVGRPEPLGRNRHESTLRTIELADDLAVVVADDGLVVVDVSDPRSLRLVRHVPWPDSGIDRQSSPDAASARLAARPLDDGDVELALTLKRHVAEASIEEFVLHIGRLAPGGAISWRRTWSSESSFDPFARYGINAIAFGAEAVYAAYESGRHSYGSGGILVLPLDAGSDSDRPPPWSVEGHAPRAITIEGDRLFAAVGSATLGAADEEGIYALSIGARGALSEIGRAPMSIARPNLVRDGDRLWLTDLSINRIHEIDAATPTELRVISEWPVQWSVTGIAADGGRVALVRDAHRILELAPIDPSSGERTPGDAWTLAGHADELAVDDDHIFAFDATLSVRRPRRIPDSAIGWTRAELGVSEGADRGAWVAVGSSHLFVATPTDIQLFDPAGADPEPWRDVGAPIATIRVIQPTAMAVDGSTVWIASNSRIDRFDISEAGVPEPVAGAELPFEYWGSSIPPMQMYVSVASLAAVPGRGEVVSVDHDGMISLWSTVADGRLERRVIAGEPPRPYFPSSGDGSPAGARLAIGGDHLFVVDDGLSVYALEPSDDGPVASLELGPARPLAIALGADTAFVLTDGPELLAIDVSDASAPRLAGSHRLSAVATDLVLDDNEILLAMGDLGVARVRWARFDAVSLDHEIWLPRVDG